MLLTKSIVKTMLKSGKKIVSLIKKIMAILKPTTTQRIFSLRAVLYTISQASYTFASISKNYPIEQLNEEVAQDVAVAYEKLIADTYKQLGLAMDDIKVTSKK